MKFTHTLTSVLRGKIFITKNENDMSIELLPMSLNDTFLIYKTKTENSSNSVQMHIG